MDAEREPERTPDPAPTEKPRDEGNPAHAIIVRRLFDSKPMPACLVQAALDRDPELAVYLESLPYLLEIEAKEIAVSPTEVIAIRREEPESIYQLVSIQNGGKKWTEFEPELRIYEVRAVDLIRFFRFYVKMEFPPGGEDEQSRTE